MASESRDEVEEEELELLLLDDDEFALALAAASAAWSALYSLVTLVDDVVVIGSFLFLTAPPFRR